jgi:release factor glutamine methyltransferase
MSVATLHATMAAARGRIVAAGVPSDEAAVDVDLYVRTILGWDRARLIIEQSSATPDALEPRFSQWVERRTRREPSAYIIGTREFWGLDLIVSPAVLIPRPETEFIVEEALRLLDRTRPTRIADVGTGSGNIAVSLAHEVRDSQVVATDVSADALVVAQQNAERHGVADRVTFVCTSYLAGVDGPFDLIAANPPYVREIDKPGLSPTVRHEPDVALFGGQNGMRDIEGVLDSAVPLLRAGGWFLMEFGLGQEDDVRARIAARPALRLERVIADLQGIPRTAVAERRHD